MKKLVMMFLLIGTCHNFITAQNFSLGLRTGITASSYWKMKEDDGGNRLLTQPNIGVLLTYPLTERLSLQAELNYAPKGDAWYFDDESGRRKEIRDVYNYLEIPVLAKFAMIESPLQVYGIGGLYFAHALSNHYTEDGKNYKVEFSSSDIGLQLGAGAAMPLGPGRAFTEVRFAQGLKNLDVFGDGTITRLKNIGLSIGWMMELK